ncbi:phosphotransferase enzyme family protein [Penicillium capsulatum]|uniref:Phosphotransferase enzyme family protein n=1 Tax=Penicillium capsulatum TaxID=69766 RepID=A0A9W9ISX0_9EURO|nr:phosphotransferase enzyme family protein [Penicillium capsulatum]
MENGKEVLARIPNPNAGNPQSVVASEAATLDFHRDVLDIPVPKVMGSSSHLSQNPVGAEYILMERVKCRQLSDVWDTMSEAQRFDPVKSLVEIERRLASTSFAGYGSLYHKDTIPSHNSMGALVGVDEGTTPEFVLGPTTERSFWENEKQELEIDRGPYFVYTGKTAQEYLTAITNREIALVQN